MISELFVLMSVNPVSGRFFPVPRQVFDLSLAGALLLDASFNSLINDDWEKLTVLGAPETGNQAIDEMLRCLLVFEHAIPLHTALALVAAHGRTLRREVMDSLHAGGLMIRKKQNIVTRTHKQELFSINLPAVIDIHKKIRKAVILDEIPDSDVPALISLMVAGGLTGYILKPEEADRFREKIEWLAGMESLGREIIRSVRSLEKVNLEKNAAALIGLHHDEPKTFAGGMDAVLSALSYLYKETGINRSRKIITDFNQVGGFECPGCAWPNPDGKRSHFGFCENGAKNVSAEATIRLITREFFEKWSLQDLLLVPDYWLEQQGRLTEPMFLDENATHYKPVTWDEAYRIIGDELQSLSHPDEAVFYASGRTSNEAAFLYQLLARTLGTNNLPTSANLCHEPSGKALTRSLGFGKSSVSLDDFQKADVIFLFGHNPGSNHPRMLSTLQSAVRKGCRIIAVNPMPEASLMGFADPQEPGTYFGKQTPLAHLYLQPVINGDMALVRGMIKATLEEESRTGGILDHGFIGEYTSGFDEFKHQVMNTPWDEVVSAAGVEKSLITEAARIYYTAGNVIVCWCLGIVHHKNAIETISEIINLMLLRGNIGRPGAGVCPVRGHSNIQGMRTSGDGENMPVPFLKTLEQRFNIKVPRTPGMSVIPALKSMYEGQTKVLVSLGGNLASSAPDTPFVEKALQNCRLTVMISTKLNRSHVITGKKALILPCLARTEEDIRKGVKQFVTIEDALGKIGFSQGCLPAASPDLRSEISIIAGMAEVILDNNNRAEWQHFANDYRYIRTVMSQTIPAFRDLDKIEPTGEPYYLDNPLQKRIFNTGDGKAHFSNHPLDWAVPEDGELLLMTIRSHDQFNTSIFGLNDRYRGINNERRVLFMNREDMDRRNIAPEQMVDITGHQDGIPRFLKGWYAIPYPIRKGCAAAYFPETNVLIPIDHTCKGCETPAFKSVRVQVSITSWSSPIIVF